MTLVHNLDRPAESSSRNARHRPHAAPVADVSTASNSEPIWQPSMRYVDQPMSWSTRLFGIGGITAIVLLILGVALLTWRTYTAQAAPPALSVFDVAEPAAPPEPERETPPGPEQTEREKPLPDPERTKIDLPEILIANSRPVSLPRIVPDPGPPIDQTTAPESKPAPPAPQVSDARPTWQGQVLSALNKARRYPRDAQRSRQQGVPWIRFIMNRNGEVLSVTLARSSGFQSLDEEAVKLPKRAQPLPKPPDDVPGETIELVVPVEFFLR